MQPSIVFPKSSHNWSNRTRDYAVYAVEILINMVYYQLLGPMTEVRLIRESSFIVGVLEFRQKGWVDREPLPKNKQNLRFEFQCAIKLFTKQHVLQGKTIVYVSIQHKLFFKIAIIIIVIVVFTVECTG